MLSDLKSLPDDPDELQLVTELLMREVMSLALMIEELQHQLHGTNRRRFGSKSENVEQLRLLQENAEFCVASTVSTAPDETAAEKPEGKEKPKRKLLPDHLERITQIQLAGSGNEENPDCAGLGLCAR